MDRQGPVIGIQRADWRRWVALALALLLAAPVIARETIVVQKSGTDSQARGADAESSCRAALAIDPGYAEALSLLGELCADQGRFREAEELFQRAIAADPHFPFGFCGIAAHRRCHGRGYIGEQARGIAIGGVDRQPADAIS